MDHITLSWRRDEKLAIAKALSANANRTDSEQELLEDLVRSLANLTERDEELRGGYGCFRSSGRPGAGTPRHYSIVYGGLPGHGKR